MQRLIVGKVLELRAELVVVLDERGAQCESFLAGQCQALESLRQDVCDNIIKELGGQTNERHDSA